MVRRGLDRSVAAVLVLPLCIPPVACCFSMQQPVCCSQFVSLSAHFQLLAAVPHALFAARIRAAREGHKGALLPSHIRQAYAQLEAERRTPHSRALRKPLR